ncbi:hypothetical protein K438DRAFT_1989813 [Mycena galopus ATCC 62051]|nr:hypothetical protein K438DRAFT_1989813 [Mycena galopus ATCC 62051]
MKVPDMYGFPYPVPNTSPASEYCFGFHHDGDQARGSFLRPPQAATGKLNIARHKSYHPYRCENIEKVRHDEEEARQNEAKEEGRMLLADSEAWVDLFSEGRAGVKESSTVEYGVQTILAPPAYTSLSPFQRPPQSKHPRTRFTHARWHSSDAERAWVSRRVWMRTDLHARLCACQHAALFSISSNSTSSFAHSDPTHIAGGALLHAHGDCPPFPVCDATLECGPFTRTVLSVPYEGVRGRPCATCSATSSSIITTRAPSAAQPHEHRDAAHEGAPQAQAQHHEDYDAQFVLKHHRTIGPFSAAPLLTPARAIHYGRNGQLFRG